MKDVVIICRFRMCCIFIVFLCIYIEGGCWDDIIVSLYEEIELVLNYEIVICMK